MKAMLRLDYVTINFPQGSMSRDKASMILSGMYDLNWIRLGKSENAPYNSPHGLYWLENNGYAELPHRLSISGVGCEKFGITIPGLYSSDSCRTSRVDFAFDVLVKKDKWKEWLKQVIISSFDSERKLKKYSFIGNGEATTVYIGSRNSDRYFRIYNKSLENPRYIYIDGDGNEVECPGDSYIIRYETELKRKKHDKRIFDPSPLFVSYYDEDHSQVYNFVKKAWLSAGNDILLPDDFENWEFTAYSDKQKFCAKQEIENYSKNGIEVSESKLVHEKIHDFPRTFESTIQYIVRQYGHYMPYIMIDKYYREACLNSCKNKFGFVPDWYVEINQPVFYELDDLLEEPFEALVGDQLHIDILNESEV